ncbi:MAG: MazG nucleotide pyrophosphohydrolase domain-containing protein [bacterium]
MKNDDALSRAMSISTDAAQLGFDWPRTEQALEKVIEEANELLEALRCGHGISDELGDLLFSVVNVARKCDVDPGQALDGTNAKFSRRFAYVTEQLHRRGSSPEASTLEEMDSLWEEAKRLERGEAARG